MSEKNLKILTGVLVVLFLWSFFKGGRDEVYYGDINIAAATVDAAEGLDLKAVGELVKKAKNAEVFETLLNKPEGVNNLDLNQDGKVDYIHVSEYGNDTAKGFSLTVHPEEGETQEVATIEIEKDTTGERADVNIQGNQQIYGNNYYYHESHFIRNMLIFGYLFNPHPFYYSPYRFGYYPRYYGGGYRTVSRRNYSSKMRGFTSSSTARRSSSVSKRSNISSPNRGKTAAKGIRTSLRNPTRSQKSFRTRSMAKAATRSGGFGRQRFGRSVRSGGFGRSGGFKMGK